MPMIKCPICGITAPVRNKGYRTCGGEKCKAEHARRQKHLLNVKHGQERRERGEGRTGMEYEHRECPQCHKPFEVWVKSNKIYCSDPCRRAREAELSRKRKAGVPRVVAARFRKMPIDTLWPTIRPVITCQDYDYPVHTNHAAFCPFPGVAA